MGNVEGAQSPTVAVIPMSKFCKHFKGSRAKVNRILKMKYYYYHVPSLWKQISRNEVAVHLIIKRNSIYGT